jgi:hypothetical protein
MSMSMRWGVLLVSLPVLAGLGCGGAISEVGQPDPGDERRPTRSPDPGRSDPSVADAGARVDANGCFDLSCREPFASLPGSIWLVGWSGGLDHYSWVRFGSMTDGKATFLSGGDLPGNVPYWNCSGDGEWSPSAKIDTIALTFPTSCGVEPRVLALTFDVLSAPAPTPKNAIGGAHLKGSPPDQRLNAWKFPLSQCDAAMTACANPF